MTLPPFETSYLQDELPCVRLGRGPKPLVVLPGINDALQDAVQAVRKWRWFFREWTSGRTVWVISRRRRMPDGFSTKDMAGDYAQALTALGGRFDVVGLSMGGLIAQHLAADYPQVIHRLVLGVTAHRNGDEAKDWLRGGAKLAQEREWAKLYEALSERVYVGAKQSIYAALPRALPRAVLPTPADPQNYVVSSAACIEHDGLSRLPFIAASTLVIGAELDRFFPAPLVRQTAAAIPGATLHMIAGVGHGATEEAKAEFDGRVLEHLSAG